VAAFVGFAGVVGPLCSAVVGTAASVWGAGGTCAEAAGWLVGDGLGALVVAPVFVALRTPRVSRSSVEVVAGGMTLASVSLLAFRHWDLPVDTVLPYLVLPPLVWAAFRLGLRGAAFGVAAVGMLGGWSTSIGYGPFAAAAGASATMLFQIYLAVLAVTALLIAALVAGLSEREEIQRVTECRQRQQAALADLGQRVLVAEQAEEVLSQLDVALRTIDRRPGESPPHRAADPGTQRSHAGPGSPQALVGDGPTDPWEPLTRHRSLLDQRSFVEAHPIGAGSAVLATSAATLAGNALDRLEQEARLRERAAELESLNAQLARANTFREQLVSRVSRELRSPLTPILGFAAVLRRSIAGEASESMVALEAIERNARRMLAWIDELLLSARAADGELDVRTSVIEVASSVRRTLEYGLDHVEVVVAGPEPVWALVDPGRLAQCVLDLVTNAVKYGEPPVVVEVRNDGAEHVVIEVSDQGEGAPAEIVPVLFDRFTRGELPTDDLSRGIGLGRSIVQRGPQRHPSTSVELVSR
jgi:signal transduction histidine kinase